MLGFSHILTLILTKKKKINLYSCTQHILTKPRDNLQREEECISSWLGPCLLLGTPWDDVIDIGRVITIILLGSVRSIESREK